VLDIFVSSIVTQEQKIYTYVATNTYYNQREEWIRVLEINESINDLLGYKLVGGTTKKRPEREQPIREAKNNKTKK
jgi:hypothetical protein